MPYTITSFDGNFTIDALTIDTANTALALPGKDYSGWGQPYSNNFAHLLENFAVGEPDKKRTGQLWYDTTAKRLKIWDSRDGGAWSLIGNNQADTAERLANARTISVTGDAAGSASFDGSANATINVALTPILGNPGFFSSPAFTVDATGRITSIDNTGGDGVGPAQYVTMFNGRSANVALTYADVVNALGYVPVANAGITNLTQNAIITALGFTPVNKAGDTMTGQLDMNYNPISHAGNVTAYGNLRMGTGGTQFDAAGNRLQNVGSPSASTDAATKGYVDSKVGGGGGGNVTVSSNPPSGGSSGDVWYRY